MQVLATGEHSGACQGSHIFPSWASAVKSHGACVKGAGEGEGGKQRIGCRSDPSRKNVVQTRQGCMVWMCLCPFPVISFLEVVRGNILSFSFHCGI